MMCNDGGKNTYHLMIPFSSSICRKTFKRSNRFICLLFFLDKTDINGPIAAQRDNKMN